LASFVRDVNVLSRAETVSEELATVFEDLSKPQRLTTSVFLTLQRAVISLLANCVLLTPELSLEFFEEGCLQFGRCTESSIVEKRLYSGGEDSSLTVARDEME